MGKSTFRDEKDFLAWVVAACNHTNMKRDVFDNGAEVAVYIGGQRKYICLKDESSIKDTGHE